MIVLGDEEIGTKPFYQIYCSLQGILEHIKAFIEVAGPCTGKGLIVTA